MFELADKHINIVHGYINQSSSAPLVSYLAAHSLIIIYADLEQEVTRAVTSRCNMNEDPYGNKFIAKAVNRRVQSIKFADLSGLLKDFDNSYKAKFKSMFPEHGQSRIYYGNIINNRHSVAHGYTSNATWVDITVWWPEARKIVEAFCNILETDTG